LLRWLVHTFTRSRTAHTFPARSRFTRILHGCCLPFTCAVAFHFTSCYTFYAFTSRTFSFVLQFGLRILPLVTVLLVWLVADSGVRSLVWFTRIPLVLPHTVVPHACGIPLGYIRMFAGFTRDAATAFCRSFWFTTRFTAGSRRFVSLDFAFHLIWFARFSGSHFRFGCGTLLVCVLHSHAFSGFSTPHALHVLMPHLRLHARCVLRSGHNAISGSSVTAHATAPGHFHAVVWFWFALHSTRFIVCGLRACLTRLRTRFHGLRSLTRCVTRTVWTRAWLVYCAHTRSTSLVASRLPRFTCVTLPPRGCSSSKRVASCLFFLTYTRCLHAGFITARLRFITHTFGLVWFNITPTLPYWFT